MTRKEDNAARVEQQLINFQRGQRFADDHHLEHLHVEASIRSDGDGHAAVMVWFELPLSDPEAAAELLARIDEIVQHS